MKIKQKFSFYFKRNIILRVKGSSFIPKLEMQMRSSRDTSAATDNSDCIASFHHIAFVTKNRSVMFINGYKTLIMLNTNSISAISAPVGEEYGAIAGKS